MPPNHPNRGRSHPSANPSPEAIRAARERFGLSVAQAAVLVHATATKWEEWEWGDSRMHPGLFELFQIKAPLSRIRD